MIAHMIILRDSTGITIKRRITDISHVRIGVTQISYWVSGYDGVRRTSELNKPHHAFTISEMADMICQLADLQRLHSVDN